MFDEIKSVEDAIIIGFGLEQGLREFYLKMLPEIKNDEARDMFTKLADIEILHQRQLLVMYTDITGDRAEFDDFMTRVVEPSMEGGISTDEYMNMFNPDLNKELDVLSLAMSIEAQALDLYSRAAQKAEDEQIAAVLQQIANEERSHLDRLAQYIEKLTN